MKKAPILDPETRSQVPIVRAVRKARQEHALGIYTSAVVLAAGATGAAFGILGTNAYNRANQAEQAQKLSPQNIFMDQVTAAKEKGAVIEVFDGPMSFPSNINPGSPSAVVNRPIVIESGGKSYIVVPSFNDGETLDIPGSPIADIQSQVDQLQVGFIPLDGQMSPGDLIKVRISGNHWVESNKPSVIVSGVEQTQFYQNPTLATTS